MKNLKKVLALVLAFACAFTMFAGAAFTDQADIESSDAVDTLVALGVIQGYTDGSFRPETTVTRAEMAKMIYTILNGGNDDASAYENLPTSFTDLTEDWYKGYVKYLQNSDIIAGTSATTFAPNETVTGVEAAKMMLVAAGYTPDKAGLTGLSWRVNTMRYANANSLFADVNCDINSGLPRQYAAQILYNSLDMENVVYSKDIEGFKPATDVSEDRTIGGKYMDLVTYEGILSGSGDFGSYAGTDKIGMKTVKKVNNSSADQTKYYNMTWDYAEDVTDLVGQYVKVLTGKNDKVYGVSAVASENLVVTAALSDIKTIAGADKVKIDDTEYKYETGAALYGFASDTTIGAIATTSYNSADTITFISNDGDKTFDVAYIDPIAEVAKVTYVSSENFTAGGTSYDYDEVIAPSDLAKDDYVVKTTDRYTGDAKFVKADKVSGKVTSTKGAVTDIKLADSDVWYKVAAPTVSSISGKTLVGFDANSDALALDNTYDLIVVNGVVYKSTKTAIGSSNTALLTGFSGAYDTDGHMQAKLLFADGSEKVVPTDDSLSGSPIGVGTASTAFVTYTVDDGVYEIDQLNNSAIGTDGSVKDVFGTDYTYTSVKSASFNASTDKLDGKRVADDAVIYVRYKDGGDFKNTVITGAKLNDIASNFGDTVAYVDDGNMIVAAVIVGSTYLPGASDSKLYGYVTSDVVENNVNGTTYKSFDIWTSEGETINAKMKASITVKKGDLVSFELAEDNFIEGVKAESASGANKLDTVTAAIKQVGSSFVMFYTATDETEKSDYKLSDDVQYLYLNTKDVKGVNGGELVKADKNTDINNGGAADNVYYKNVKYVLDESNEIVMIAIDVNLNKWDQAGSIDTTKTAANQ